MTAIEEAAALIRRSPRIALATHVSPDSDAVGSMLGLGIGLQTSGKVVLMLSDDDLPDAVTFLPGLEDIVRQIPVDFNADLFIGVDASDAERLGGAAKPLLDGSIPILNIDHHVTNVSFGDVNIVMPTTSSCAEVIMRLLDALPVTITDRIATCLMAGLVGDTRGFSTSSVTPETLLVASRLIEAGANLADISERLMSRHSLDSLRVWGLALSNLQSDGIFVWASIPIEERKSAGIRDVSNTGLSNLLLTVPEAAISAIFTERTDGLIEISMRARPGFDVATVALSLGGGGHPAAAGCTIGGPLDKAIDQVLSLLKTAAGAD